MDRRRFLASLGGFAAVGSVSGIGANAQERIRRTSDKPPRKVIVGTAMQSFWGPYPGLRSRLEQLTRLGDQMAGQATQAYGRGLDLAVLPEVAITGEAGDDVFTHSVAFAGEVKETFTRAAREHACYIVVPTYLVDSKEKKRCSNAAILVGRKGEV